MLSDNYQNGLQLSAYQCEFHLPQLFGRAVRISRSAAH